MSLTRVQVSAFLILSLDLVSDVLLDVTDVIQEHSTF